MAGEIHHRHVGLPDAVGELADHPPQAPLVKVLAIGDVEAEPRQRVAHAARIVDRIGELVCMAVRGVADDEGDALFCMGRKRASALRQMA
jgi:hypothetical protein